MPEEPVSPKWWGKYSIPLNQVAYWRIGPLEIWIRRTDKEWRIGTRNHDLITDTTLVVNRDDGPELPEDEGIVWNRFGFRQTSDKLQVSPVLAPRALVVSPDTTFVLPQKEEAALHISTPVWVRFELGQPVSQVFEQVTFRPSDTWFGPSTMEGEFCFASRTRARLDLHSLDSLPHRVFSAFIIRNRAKSELKIDRLKLPMPNLSVFAAGSGRLWTEAVTLHRREDGDFAELQVGKGPPKEVQSPQLLSGPRSKPEKGLLIRSFGGLFG